MYMGLLNHHMGKLNSWLGSSIVVECLDEARPGCSLEVTDEEICKKVCDMVFSDR